MIIFQKLLIEFYQKIAKIRVINIMITIPLTLVTKQQLTIKPRRRSLVQEKIKKNKIIQKKLEKITYDHQKIAGIRDINILKNKTLHLETKH